MAPARARVIGRGMSDRPAKCPACNSTSPTAHPMSPITQRPSICADPFHDTSAERAQLNELLKAMVALARERFPGCRFAVYLSNDAVAVATGAANFVPLQPELDAWSSGFDQQAVEGKLGPALKAMADKWLRENRPLIVQ